MLKSGKILSVALSIIILFGIFGLINICVAEGSGDFVYEIIDDRTVEISSYIGTESDLIIPSIIDGYTVVNIGDYAFEECESLIKVTIPDSVVNIFYHAFFGCKNLTEVIIPDSVAYVDYTAFGYCESLTSITVDKNNSSYFSDEYGVLFQKDGILIQFPVNNKMNEYTIPDNVTGINECAFSKCKSLTKVIIPDGVTCIGGGAFGICSSLTEITIPDSVTFIGIEAFLDCNSLETIYYTGTEEQWDNIEIGFSNDSFIEGKIIYNWVSEEPQKNEDIEQNDPMDNDSFVDNNSSDNENEEKFLHIAIGVAVFSTVAVILLIIVVIVIVRKYKK